MSKDLYEVEDAFDEAVRDVVPDAFTYSGSAFVSLNARASLFVILERPEDADVYFLLRMMHHGMWRVDEDSSERKRTSSVCLRVISKDTPCAVCDWRDLLKGTGRPVDKKKSDSIKPKKKSYISVWWVPVKLAGRKPSEDSFRLGGKLYDLDGEPQHKILGLPPGVWKDVKGLVADSGEDKMVGIDAFPVYVTGNGQDGLARKYDGAKILMGGLPEELLPPEEDGLNILENETIPSPRELAELVELNAPGVLGNLEVYGEFEAPAAESTDEAASEDTVEPRKRGRKRSKRSPESGDSNSGDSVEPEEKKSTRPRRRAKKDSKSDPFKE